MENHLNPFHRDILNGINMNPQKPPLILKDKQREWEGDASQRRQRQAGVSLTHAFHVRVFLSLCVRFYGHVCFFWGGSALRVLVRRPKAEEETIEEDGV